jgi:hypothetical protein
MHSTSPSKRSRFAAAFAAAAAALFLVTSPAAPAIAAPNVNETTVLSRIPLGFLARMIHRGTIAPSGAMGKNIDGYKTVEYQSFAGELTAYALPARDASTIEQAYRVANYGFSYEQNDGSFPGGGASAAAFFTMDTGHMLVLLDASDWFNNDASTQSLVSRLPGMRRKEGNALAYLMAKQSSLEQDNDAANRLARYADAYYFAGMSTQNPQAIAVGKSFLRKFLADQGQDGTFYELNGFDSSYQCASLYLGEILFLNMPHGPLRDQLWQALVRGMNREQQALSPSGAISTFHNTRTGADSQYAIRTGTVYGLDTAHAALAFQYYAAITGNPVDIQNARAVSLNYWPGSVP